MSSLSSEQQARIFLDEHKNVARMLGALLQWRRGRLDRGLWRSPADEQAFRRVLRTCGLPTAELAILRRDKVVEEDAHVLRHVFETPPGLRRALGQDFSDVKAVDVDVDVNFDAYEPSAFKKFETTV